MEIGKPLAVATVTNLEEPIPPCGACRHVIAEFNPEAVLIMYSAKSKKYIVKNLKEIFPQPFTIKKWTACS